jgi:hypothetical protein
LRFADDILDNYKQAGTDLEVDKIEVKVEKI